MLANRFPLVCCNWVFLATILTQMFMPVFTAAQTTIVNSKQASVNNTPSLSLVFFSDVHALPESDSRAALKLAAEAINNTHPDLIIGGGDYIKDNNHHSPQEMSELWKAYRGFQDALKAPMLGAIGNHDLVAALLKDGTSSKVDSRAYFRSNLNQSNTWYAVDRGGYHFVLLDPIVVVGGSDKIVGTISEEQLRWIRRDAEILPPAMPVVLVSHMPLLTSFFQATEGATAAAPKNRVLTNNREVVAAYGNRVVLVLQGHLHVYEKIEWQGVTYITGGAISGDWWHGAWHGTEPGFTLIRLQGRNVESKYLPF